MTRTPSPFALAQTAGVSLVADAAPVGFTRRGRVGPALGAVVTARGLSYLVVDVQAPYYHSQTECEDSCGCGQHGWRVCYTGHRVTSSAIEAAQSAATAAQAEQARRLPLVAEVLALVYAGTQTPEVEIGGMPTGWQIDAGPPGSLVTSEDGTQVHLYRVLGDRESLWTTTAPRAIAVMLELRGGAA